MLTLLNEHKEWVFSGIGITVSYMLVIVGKDIVRWMNRRRSSRVPDLVEPNDNDVSSPTPPIPEPAAQRTDVSAEVDLVVTRFKQCCAAHGIAVTRIPQVVPPAWDIQLYDLRNDTAFLQKLDEQALSWLCTTFGVRRAWLNGTDTSIYHHRTYYRAIPDYLYLLHQIIHTTPNITIYAIKDVADLLPCEHHRPQYVVLVLAYTMTINDTITIPRYIVDGTLWDWGYWRGRYQLKAIIRLCEHYFTVYPHTYGLFMQGCDAPRDMLHQLTAGLLFPGDVIAACQRGTWYPHDYTAYPTENVHAQEVTEIDKVVAYMDQQRYIHRLEEMLTEPD